MRTLLFVSSRPVWPPADGVPSRLAALLPVLRGSWRVVLASPDEPVSVDFGALSAHHFIPTPGTDGDGLPCHSVERLIRIESPAAIILGTGAECLAFRRTRIWPAIIVDRCEGRPRRGLGLGLAYEWRLLRAVTQTIVASEEDRRFLMRLNNRALITTVADEEHDAWHQAADRYSSVVDEAVRVARVSGPHTFREFALGA